MNRNGRKRLSIDLPKHLHDSIKRASINHNCTMTKWMIMAIIDKLKLEQDN